MSAKRVTKTTTVTARSAKSSKPALRTSRRGQAVDDRALNRRVSRLAKVLLAEGHTLSVAESCTGGWLAKVLTDRAGSSAWFIGGLVVYSNASKQREGLVAQSTLVKHGAVSEATVLELANGCLQRYGSDWSIAISGIAGPAGGSDAKPVGTVWMAVGERTNAHGHKPAKTAITTFWCQFTGSREQIRRQSVAYALDLLKTSIEA